MATFNQKHPQMAAKVADYIESGLTPEDIIMKFKEEDEAKALAQVEGSFEETFADEIVVISQALAYRAATWEDLDELKRLISSAYLAEVDGEEAFRERDEEDNLSGMLTELLQDANHHWLVIEAPSGRDIEKDGVILGAACFTADGVARYNGVVQGNVGSIRFFAVLPRYHGFCIGRRLLGKLEHEMCTKYSCCKCLVSIPSTRQSLMEWIDRRGYRECGTASYPTQLLQHTIRAEFATDLVLVKFVKDLIEVDSPGIAVSQKLPATERQNTSPRSISQQNRVDEPFIPEID